MKAVLAAVCAGALLASGATSALAKTSATKAAHAKPAKIASVYDAPLKTLKVTLPANEVGAKPKVTCSIYAHFMVKQVDEGEVGAAQLSIVPLAPGAKPVCQRKNIPGEKVVDPKDWSGYADGVKGDYVFFSADDGVNGGLGFAIVAAGTGKKLFEDSAVGKLKAVTLAGDVLTVRYARSYSAECSVPHDGTSCWSKIATTTGETSAKQPDCDAGYLKAKNEMAKGRCEANKKAGPACMTAALKELDRQRWNEAPTVIVYDAETVLKGGSATTRPLGAPTACHPSD
ncbi:MAG TPA: hypothetical protein VJN67_07240 [Stellaceae bacterium]|nr:hypothetical protein [Stellaceae bacterium]